MYLLPDGVENSDIKPSVAAIYAISTQRHLPVCQQPNSISATSSPPAR